MSAQRADDIVQWYGNCLHELSRSDLDRRPWSSCESHIAQAPTGTEPTVIDDDDDEGGGDVGGGGGDDY